jgi:hypothetical protein
MDQREMQRKLERDSKNKSHSEALKEKQQLNQMKLSETKIQMQQLEATRRQEFTQKERLNDEKRRIFETTRQDDLTQKQREATEKAAFIKNAIQRAGDAKHQKKLSALAKFDKAAEQKDQKDLEKKLAVEEQKEANYLNQLKMEKVRKQNEENAAGRVNKIQNDREMKERALEAANKQREEERIYKANLDAMKGLDKQDNVKRNERRKEYERNQLMMKQEAIDEKISRIKQEKANVRENRQVMKKQIDMDKASVQAKFTLVQQGKADPSILMKEVNCKRLFLFFFNRE